MYFTGWIRCYNPEVKFAAIASNQEKRMSDNLKFAHPAGVGNIGLKGLSIQIHLHHKPVDTADEPGFNKFGINFHRSIFGHCFSRIRNTHLNFESYFC